MALTLYSFPLSGHAHRARLFLSLIGVEASIAHVNMMEGEHKSPEFLSMNPFGQVPVLDDDGVVIPDSNAILVYLAKKFERTDWLPEDPVTAARVQQWLSVAAGQIAFGPCAARLRVLFNAPYDKDDVTTRSMAIFERMDAELSQCDFIVGDNPTIADVALYSYTARAPEGDIDISSFVHVNAWLNRMESLPHFVPFEPYQAA